MTKNEITLVTKENVLSSNADANINVGYDATISFCKKIAILSIWFFVRNFIACKTRRIITENAKNINNIIPTKKAVLNTDNKSIFEKLLKIEFSTINSENKERYIFENPLKEKQIPINMQIDIKILKMSEIVMIIFSLTLTPPVFKQLYNRKEVPHEK